MSECPQCHRAVADKATRCPYCSTELSAFGHPGMPLHRATDGDYLCATCAYDADDTCNFPQRPQAKTCTLYTVINAPKPQTPAELYPIPWWRKVSKVWLAVAVMFVVYVLIAAL